MGLAMAMPTLAQTNRLWIPPTLEGPTYDLTMHRTQHEFFDGEPSDTYSFNETYLGPTLIWNKGEQIQLDVHNQLGEPTTVHWHGAHVAPKNDGGPHTVIEDGTTWQPNFEVLDQATTLWYHPHLHMHTNEHVYRGLAGMIIVRDEAEAGLALPRTYGIDDIPVMLQDRWFRNNRSLRFSTSNEAGASGNVMVINGVIEPFVEVPAQVVRLRLVNASGARVYNLGFEDRRSFFQIGTDGGLLEVPVELDRLVLSPGERAEILIDASDLQDQRIDLMSFASELGREEPGSTPGIILNNPLDGGDFHVLSLDVIAPIVDGIRTVPSELLPLDFIDESEATVTRTFTLDVGHSINNRLMDLNFINERVVLGSTEIWEIRNESFLPHPFHIHDIQFYILDRDGQPPPPNERGRKDVVMVYRNETVRVIGTFATHADNNIPYMYHCHFLGHEDLGMMGQFIVYNPAVANEDAPETPDYLHLFQNYPNPVAEETTILFELPEPEAVRLVVYDVQGKAIETIHEGLLPAGQHQYPWDARPYPSGTYFYRLHTSTRAPTGIMTVLR
ncbi:MAG: multicopper oxidase domain-containing protein [Rhodothermales bacterium]